MATLLLLSAPLARADLDYPAELGQPGRPGGVDHTYAKDQNSGEICWSYTLSAMAEAGFKAATGEEAHVGPEYMQFWHIYYQIKKHLNVFHADRTYLAKDAALSPRDNSTEAKKTRTRAEHVRQAYGIGQGHKPNVNLLFQPDVGNVEGQALQEVRLFGLVPDALLTSRGKDLQITTDQQEHTIEMGIPQFIRDRILRADDNYSDDTAPCKATNVFCAGKSKIYRYTDSAGQPATLNLELYYDLTMYFSNALRLNRLAIHRLPLPNEAFAFAGTTRAPVQGGQITPLAYMRNFLRFDPTQYVAFRTLGMGDKIKGRAITQEEVEANQQLAMYAIAEAVSQNQLVPIGITLFDDDDPSDTTDSADKRDLQWRAQEQGAFTEQFCPMDPATGTRNCHNASGGHEISTVNYLYRDQRTSALIIKNSWGNTMGRDVNGVLPPKSAKSTDAGFFIVTAEYLRQTAVNFSADDDGKFTVAPDPFDFVLPARLATKYVSQGLDKINPARQFPADQ
jgi:hypothetical protein